MGFHVEPAALGELAHLLDRARVDVGNARKHLAEHNTFHGRNGEGLLNMTLDSHQTAYQTLSDWLGKLADTTLTDVSAAVTDSADYYQNTDTATAEALDQTYPQADVAEAREHSSIPISPGPGAARFSDTVRPTFEEPGDYSISLYGGLPNWWDLASPMSWAGRVIEGVTGFAVMLGWKDTPFNPQVQIARKFLGDWVGVRAWADVLRTVGAAVHASSINIRSAARQTEDVWQGNAGDGVVVYLMELSNPLSDAQEPIDKLAQQYEDASAEMQRLRDAMVGVIDLMGNAAIKAMVGIKVAYMWASSGIGIAFSNLCVTYAGWHIREVVTGTLTAMELVGHLNTATSLLQAAQGGFTSTGELSLPALPNSPTNVPGR